MVNWKGVTVNSYYLLAIVLAVCIVGAVLWMRHNSTEAKTGRTRRVLLLDRAEGRVTKEEFEDRQAALDAALLEEHAGQSGLPIAAAIVGAGVITVVVLAWLGSPAPPEPMQSLPTQLSGTAMSPLGGQSSRKQGGDLRELAKPLADKLAANPDDGAGWLLLARTYLELHQFKEAEAAFEKASTRVTNDAPMLVDWTEVKVAANAQTWTPAALSTLKKALTLDPNNLKGLTLAANEADSRNDARQAAIYRARIAKLGPPGLGRSPEAALGPMKGRP